MAKAEALCLVDHMFLKSDSIIVHLPEPVWNSPYANHTQSRQPCLKTAYAAVSRKASKTSEKLSLTSKG